MKENEEKIEELTAKVERYNKLTDLLFQS